MAASLDTLHPESNVSDASAALALLTFLVDANGGSSNPAVLASGASLHLALFNSISAGASPVAAVQVQLGIVLQQLLSADRPLFTAGALRQIVRSLAPPATATPAATPTAEAALLILRTAGMHSLSPTMFQHLDASSQATSFQHALLAASSGAVVSADVSASLSALTILVPAAAHLPVRLAGLDTPGALRIAARQALEVLPLTDALVAPFLEAASQVVTITTTAQRTATAAAAALQVRDVFVCVRVCG